MYRKHASPIEKGIEIEISQMIKPTFSSDIAGEHMTEIPYPAEHPE